MPNVPVGSQQGRVFYTGLAGSLQSVDVTPGQIAIRKFPLAVAGRGTDGGPIRLDAFKVEDSREMSGTAIAINEQRFAPSMKSVVSTDEFGDVPDGNVAEFIEFLPGVEVNSAREISLNGVPSANVPISIGGFSVASPIGNAAMAEPGDRIRWMSSTSNVSRIEVSFSPAPARAPRSPVRSI